MREHKFRAWDTFNKCFLKRNGEIDEYVNPWISNRSSQYKVMQYTGLKDKNGVEIYEGDFLEGSEPGEFGSTLSRWVDVVVWDKEKAAFVCMDIGEGDILGLDEVTSDKVIGNIYTHPEWLRLIKKEFDTLSGDNNDRS